MTEICLTIINGKAYTFSSDDYMKLRIEHRIKGNLVGNLRNSNLFGLPAVYSKFEKQLLFDKKIAFLLDKNGLNYSPTETQKQNYEEFCIKNRIEQQETLVKNKVEQSMKIMDKIIAGKLKKQKKMGIKENEIKLCPLKILEEEKERVPKINEMNCLVQIPTEHPFQCDSSNIELKPDHSLKYRVFCDLWEKGKYITEGESFGGDFLVYPGDPLYFHASNIIHVLENPILDTKMLITNGRLSVNVNKDCTYAFLNEYNEIIYEIMEWEGNTYYK